jgi:hypothetical protein
LPLLHTRRNARAVPRASHFDAGWSSPVARQAHNLKVVGSNPTPATIMSARILARSFDRAKIVLAQTVRSESGHLPCGTRPQMMPIAALQTQVR